MMSVRACKGGDIHAFRPAEDLLQIEPERPDLLGAELNTQLLGANNQQIVRGGLGTARGLHAWPWGSVRPPVLPLRADAPEPD